MQHKGISKSLMATLLPTLLFSAVLAGAPPVLNGNDNENWVGTWSTSLHEPDLGVPGLANAGFNNQTLRQIIHTSVGGHQVRVRFSTFGAQGLVIGAARIALHAAGAAIVPASDRRLTFGGSPSIAIPAGALVVSDAVDLEVPALGDLAVSIFVPGKTAPATWHFEARQSVYISTSGDFTANTIMPVDAAASGFPAWYWLAGVEVTASKQTGAIVSFGDSITDGTNSTQDANKRWPDQLAVRLMNQAGNHQMGVLNEGLAGSRILHDSVGPNALARFDRDVLAQTGVTHVVVQLGDNDIGIGWSGGLSPAEEVTSDQIIQSHKQIIERAHAKGLKVYGATLTPNQGFIIPGTPFQLFSPANEVKRQAVNSWIRSSGEYDGVIDFDAVLRDPSSPARILPSLDSTDHGHPTDAGYKLLADAVYFQLFRNDGSQ
jgi:lysophospholipase L1-like esterase